ncbi:MAG: hypothetical protein ACFFG0_44840, partial [Candidatus Thorarchaeota archaeon]
MSKLVSLPIEFQEDFRKILNFFNKFYKNGYSKEKQAQFKIKLSSKSGQEVVEEYSKFFLQTLFVDNFTILKASSPNAIRHIFSNKIDIYGDLIEFFNLLKKFFRLIDVDIKMVNINRTYQPEDIISERNLYFYFKNFKSVFNFLLYWDDSLFKFPVEKILDIRNVFRDLEVYIHFDEEYMDRIFGEEGLINKEKLTTTKFFENVFDLSNYKRHSIYKWRNEKFFPATVIYDLNKSKYQNKIDID